jgi:hypothetical protein
MQARLAEEKRATSGTRTRDPRITNALLYQLSHHGFFSFSGCKGNEYFSIDEMISEKFSCR